MSEQEQTWIMQIATELAQLLAFVRDASKFSLEMALKASRIEGVGGFVIIEIPRRLTHVPDIMFVPGKPMITIGQSHAG